MKLKNIFFTLSICFFFSLSAQYRAIDNNYHLPLHIPPYLSGNFGELRNNHFHTGLDFKTQGVTSQAVYSFDDGWVSRISVSPWGYGNALYITHPSGLTTVYGHLLCFNKEIQQFVKDYQYKNESFQVDFTLKPDEITVEKGQQIALSGNTGGSAGPHLHFEVRDTKTEEALDPLPYFMGKVKDKTKPQIRAIRLYPIDGLVNGTSNYLTLNPVKNEQGVLSLSKSLTAWGNLGLGIKAYDKMDLQNNIYGVKNIRFYVDDSLYFSMQQDRVSFAKSRAINSFIDYPDWKKNRAMMMRLFVDPGNPLSCYKKIINNGIVVIDQERPYKIKMEVSDAFGNKQILNFIVNGKKQPIPNKVEKKGVTFSYNKENFYEQDGFSIQLPKGSLFTDLNFTYHTREKNQGYSLIHCVQNEYTPLGTFCEIRIPLSEDKLKDKTKYYLTQIKSGCPSYVKSTYSNGKMIASVRDFGDYWVTADTINPQISPVQQSTWIKAGAIRYRMGDSESGVKSWRGEIDGKFALFEYDGKSNIIRYKLDSTRISRNKKHTLKMEVTDNCDNKATHTTQFYW